MKPIYYFLIVVMSIVNYPAFAAGEGGDVNESEQLTNVISNDVPALPDTSEKGKLESDKDNSQESGSVDISAAAEVSGNKKDSETPAEGGEATNTDASSVTREVPEERTVMSDDLPFLSDATSSDLKQKISALEDELRVQKILAERLFRLMTERVQHSETVVQNTVESQSEMINPEGKTQLDIEKPSLSKNKEENVPAKESTRGLNTQSERESYASGTMLWREIQQSVAAQKALGIDISEEGMLQGLNDSARNTPKVSEADITASLDALNARFIRLSTEQREKQRQAGKVWLKDFRAKKGALSEKGAWYLVAEKGVGPRLKSSDTAELLVTGSLADGTFFDDSGEKGQVRTVQIGTLLPPVAAGLEKISKGGRMTIVVPPEKAYGDAGLPPVIPGGAMLIFDISVKDVH